MFRDKIYAIKFIVSSGTMRTFSTRSLYDITETNS